MKIMMTITKTSILAAALAALATGCGLSGTSGGDPPSGTVVAGLRSFENCSDLGDFLVGRKDEGSGFESPLGRPTVGTFMPMAPGEPSAEEDGGGDVAAAAPVAATVEEADLVKRDGDRLYVANASGGLLIYDVAAPAEMRRIGRLEIAGFHPLEMQIAGAKVLVVSSASGDKTKALLVDVTDPAAMSVLKTWEFAGSYQESRQVGSAAYLVLQKWVGGDEDTLKSQLREKSPCDRVYVPEDLEGGGTEYYNSWNLIGLSLADPEREPTQVSVIGSFASSVYATPEHFYLANQAFEADQTGIYLLALNPATAGIVPAATAEVPGSIINQFFMDEKDGVFRIASTARSSDDPKNYLTTFRAAGDALTQLGQIDNIVPGEAITAVRFAGPRVFLSTAVEFKDPLVSIDVSDPTNPQIKASIDLPGRPDYIHLWNDLLVTVGLGDGWASGVTLTLFNIADPDAPVLVEQETVPDAFFSEAQSDHRAFAFFEDRALLAIPVSSGMQSQIVLYRVQAGGFSAYGEVGHGALMTGTETEDYSPTMRRALEIGNAIVTVSEAGVMAHDLGDLGATLYGEMFPGFEPTEWAVF